MKTTFFLRDVEPSMFVSRLEALALESKAWFQDFSRHSERDAIRQKYADVYTDTPADAEAGEPADDRLDPVGGN